jgi:excisionase family DNA binding protein
MQKDNTMIGVKEIMEILGVCRQTAYKLLNSNEFHVIRIGRKYRVHKEVFENWLKGEKKKKVRW